MADGSEVIIIEVPESSFEEIVKDIVGSDRRDLSEDDVVIVLSSELVGKSLVGLIHLDELLVGLFIIWVALGVILDRELSIRLLDIIERSVFGHSEDSVVGI